MKYIVDIKGEIEGDYEIIGKYEEMSQGHWEANSHCSECGCFCSLNIEYTNYCPNCGASMRGSDNG